VKTFNCKLEKLCIFFILNYTLDGIDVPFFIFISIQFLDALAELQKSTAGFVMCVYPCA